MRWYIAYIKKENRIDLDGILLANHPINTKTKKRDGIYYLIEYKNFCLVEDNVIVDNNKNFNICEITKKYSELQNASKKALFRFFKIITKYEEGLLKNESNT